MSSRYRRDISQHPTDRLIRELVRTGRTVAPAEVQQIAQRIATAPFPTSAPHLAKRAREGQWTEETTPEAYVDDLRRAIRDPEGRVAVYQRRGGSLAACVTLTDRAVPFTRRGPASCALIVVVYSADRAIIVTGYQASAISYVSLPGGARWLR